MVQQRRLCLWEGIILYRILYCGLLTRSRGRLTCREFILFAVIGIILVMRICLL